MHGALIRQVDNPIVRLRQFSAETPDIELLTFVFVRDVACPPATMSPRAVGPLGIITAERRLQPFDTDSAPQLIGVIGSNCRR